MSRSFPSIPSSYNAKFGQMAQRCAIETEVAAAIDAITGDGRSAMSIWENPTDAEIDNVMMCMNEWATNGDIEPGTYNWGDPFTVNDH